MFVYHIVRIAGDSDWFPRRSHLVQYDVDDVPVAVKDEIAFAGTHDVLQCRMEVAGIRRNIYQFVQT